MIILRKPAVAAITVAGALLAASGATAVGSPRLTAATTSTPQLTVKMSGKNSLHVRVPRKLKAGRVAVKLVAGRGEQAFVILRLHGAYSPQDLAEDVKTFDAAGDQPTPQALKALRRVVRKTTFYGGLDSGSGHAVVHGTVALPKSGTYYVVNDSEGPNFDAPVVRLQVRAKSGSRRPAPASQATVRATSRDRFHGAVNLPASGTVTFENVSARSPHLMFLQHVKTGTTRKQLLKALRRNRPGPFRPGGVGVTELSPGRSATVTYDLPAGDYAEVCFFPDLKTGRPHAFMGMVRIVHLA
ncbi:MAG TPA: hypothetical protein VHE57_09870 [Mycobacteriales bacterium]|nr:hypothetical protein [Mycobacteriales bacterium]